MKLIIPTLTYFKSSKDRWLFLNFVFRPFAGGFPSCEEFFVVVVVPTKTIRCMLEPIRTLNSYLQFRHLVVKSYGKFIDFFLICLIFLITTASATVTNNTTKKESLQMSCSYIILLKRHILLPAELSFLKLKLVEFLSIQHISTTCRITSTKIF